MDSLSIVALLIILGIFIFCYSVWWMTNDLKKRIREQKKAIQELKEKALELGVIKNGRNRCF